MTELRGSIDPFEIYLFQRLSARMCEHGLAQSQDSLLDTRHRAFQ